MFKFRATIQLAWCDGWVHRATINNYCLLTLLKVSWMTAEKTVRRWTVFADCCWSKGGTAHTERPVISDKLYFYFFNIIKYNYRKSRIFFLTNIDTLHLCFLSCVCKFVPGHERMSLERQQKMACHCKKGFCTTEQWVNETESFQNVTAESFLWHLFKHQSHLLSGDFSGTASSALPYYLKSTSNIVFIPILT